MINKFARVAGALAVAGTSLSMVVATGGAANAQVVGGPTITPTPPPGPGVYTDGQTIIVDGSGFPGNAVLTLQECKPNPLSGNDCDSLTRDTPAATNAAGQYHNANFQIYKVPTNFGVPDSTPFKCDETNPCVMVLSVNAQDFSQPKAISNTFTFRSATAPPPAVPEAPYTVLLPAGGLALLGGALVIQRRRRQSAAA